MPKEILKPSSCDCCEGLSRRAFLKTSAVAASATALLPFGAVVEAADKVQPAKKTSETLVAELYKTLTEEQRAAVYFPFGDKLQSAINNAWHITEKRVKTFSGNQQELIREIFKNLHKIGRAHV